MVSEYCKSKVSLWSKLYDLSRVSFVHAADKEVYVT